MSYSNCNGPTTRTYDNFYSSTSARPSYNQPRKPYSSRTSGQNGRLAGKPKRESTKNDSRPITTRFAISHPYPPKASDKKYASYESSSEENFGHYRNEYESTFPGTVKKLPFNDQSEYDSSEEENYGTPYGKPLNAADYISSAKRNKFNFAEPPRGPSSGTFSDRIHTKFNPYQSDFSFAQKMNDFAKLHFTYNGEKVEDVMVDTYPNGKKILAFQGSNKKKSSKFHPQKSNNQFNTDTDLGVKDIQLPYSFYSDGQINPSKIKPRFMLQDVPNLYIDDNIGSGIAGHGQIDNFVTAEQRIKEDKVVSRLRNNRNPGRKNEYHQFLKAKHDETIEKEALKQQILYLKEQEAKRFATALIKGEKVGQSSNRPPRSNVPPIIKLGKSAPRPPPRIPNINDRPYTLSKFTI